MANVKVFADKQTDKRTGQKQYAPDLLMRGGGGIEKEVHMNTLKSEKNLCKE